MTLEEICKYLGCKILNDTGDLDKRQIEYIGAADLMSDVLAFGTPTMLLVTGLNSPQCVRTASVVGAAGVLIVRKREVPESTVRLAKDLEIPLLHAKISMYKACGRLYDLNLKDALEEVNGF